jgi:hypothetical protein
MNVRIVYQFVIFASGFHDGLRFAGDDALDGSTAHSL